MSNNKNINYTAFPISQLISQETSRKTFIEREMPNINIQVKGIQFKYAYMTDYLNPETSDWETKIKETIKEFLSYAEALEYEGKWNHCIYDEPEVLVSFYNPLIKEWRDINELTKEKELELMKFINDHFYYV